MRRFNVFPPYIMPKGSNERIIFFCNALPLIMFSHCTMGLSPCKMRNREFVSDYHHRPHFLEIQLFQTEIFGDCQLRSFTFELYLGPS